MRDVLRFLWVENLEDEVPQIMILRFKRVTFGVGLSPFLLNATLRHHLSRYEEADPELIQQLRETLEDDQSFAKRKVGGLEESNSNDEAKILELPWNCADDTFVFKVRQSYAKCRELEPNETNRFKCCFATLRPLWNVWVYFCSS